MKYHAKINDLVVERKAAGASRGFTNEDDEAKVVASFPEALLLDTRKLQQALARLYGNSAAIQEEKAQLLKGG